MAALGQLVDDLVFVVERGVAQLPERRKKARVARRLRVQGPALRPASSSSRNSHCPPDRRKASSFVVLSRTLLGCFIVVTALQRYPIRYDVLIGRQIADQASPGTVPAISKPRRTGRRRAPRRCRPAW